MIPVWSLILNSVIIPGMNNKWILVPTQSAYRYTHLDKSSKNTLVPTQSAYRYTHLDKHLKLFDSSFPRSAWECIMDALRLLCCATEIRAQGTQSVPYAFPRRAWEREYFQALTEMCITISAERGNKFPKWGTYFGRVPKEINNQC
jgi:hypothetical protein